MQGEKRRPQEAKERSWRDGFMVKSSCRRPKLLSAPTGGLTASVTPVPGNPLPLGECLCGYCMHRAHRYTCRQNIHRCKIKMNKKRLRPHSGYSLVKLIPRSGHSQIHTVCSVNAEDPPPLLSASPAACLLGAPEVHLVGTGRQAAGGSASTCRLFHSVPDF